MQAIKAHTRKNLHKLKTLEKQLQGDLYYDTSMRTLYATDASVYRAFPLAVAMPKNTADIKCLVAFAQQHGTSLIPRAGGTSLAGQCVGEGIVVDVSKYMHKIIAFNEAEKWVKVQPGIIRDELNHFLRPHGLFFGPNTSTANRATIGGMVGNNSSGSYSLVYGVTRDHTLEVEAVLSDTSEVCFKTLSRSEFRRKAIGNSLESQIYRHISQRLSHPETQMQIKEQFPAPAIHRRNTGYALDELMKCNVFSRKHANDFNFCRLIAGSEGTLAFITAVKIALQPLPPPKIGLLCAHFNTVNEALRAVKLLMEFKPRALELMDKTVLDCTKGNIEQHKNRFFIQGDPKAILIVECGADNEQDLQQALQTLIDALKAHNFGYHYPLVYSPNVKKVWTLRKAGLGVLANIPGDKKAVTCIEDTAVTVEALPNYINDFTKIMDSYGQQAVYYAHAGAGELHLRPILNLKDAKDRQHFRDISYDTAKLVKQYKGSLSGEHGDGRVRGEFIELMVGAKNYALFKEIKQVWDVNNVFNPNKIVDAPPMDSDLRYESDQVTREIETIFDFSSTQGILRAAEKCNGSGDCRKLPLSGGTMCPSYMATRNEKHTTRARANILREFLTQSPKDNPFDHEEIKEVLDLCLSCKGCTSECPSSVDMSTMKAEFLHQYYKANGVPFRTKLFANFNELNNIGAIAPTLTNILLGSSLTAPIAKKIMGVAKERSLPKLSPTSLKKWYNRWVKKAPSLEQRSKKGQLYLFCDEFTNHNDAHIGMAAIKLLTKLGYGVAIINHVESARTHISKGLLVKAKKLAIQNVNTFKDLVHDDMPLIGIEPSCILSFRDEYPRLVPKGDMQESAKKLAANCLLIDEFIAQEIEKGNISSAQFHQEKKHILLHAHCHQKALASADCSAWILNLPTNYSVERIPSGCCGMAGSFGYETEHYEMSMQVGELVLFPAVRKAEVTSVIAAPGTSCRHQIADGTQKIALHPVEILWAAVLK